MTIKFANTADSTRWDAYIQHHPQALLGHSFGWYAFLADVFAIQPCYWLAEERGQVVGIAPFFLRVHPVLGKRLTSMPYLNTGGILADTPAVRDALWAALADWAKAEGVTTIELRGRHDHLPAFSVRSGRTASIIPLPDSEEKAWANLRSSARNRVRKAQDAGLTAQVGFEHIEGFWRAYAENMQFLGAPVLPRRWFLRLAERPDAHLITVHSAGAVLGGMVLLDFKDGTENGWTSSAIAARSLYSNDLLYWETIRWAVGRGLAWLDMGRSQVAGGHEKFKEKFGAKTIPLPYQEVHLVKGEWQGVTNEPERLYKTFNTIWRRIPLALSSRIGGYFSRQIY